MLRNSDKRRLISSKQTREELKKVGIRMADDLTEQQRSTIRGMKTMATRHSTEGPDSFTSNVKDAMKKLLIVPPTTRGSLRTTTTTTTGTAAEKTPEMKYFKIPTLLLMGREGDAGEVNFNNRKSARGFGHGRSPLNHGRRSQQQTEVGASASASSRTLRDRRGSRKTQDQSQERIDNMLQKKGTTAMTPVSACLVVNLYPRSIAVSACLVVNLYPHSIAVSACLVVNLYPHSIAVSACLVVNLYPHSIAVSACLVVNLYPHSIAVSACLVVNLYPHSIAVSACLVVNLYPHSIAVSACLVVNLYPHSIAVSACLFICLSVCGFPSSLSPPLSLSLCDVHRLVQ
ncbi:hypothetical protein ACOMHN_024680 [Nucella lapillus]